MADMKAIKLIENQSGIKRILFDLDFPLGLGFPRFVFFDHLDPGVDERADGQEEFFPGPGQMLLRLLRQAEAEQLLRDGEANLAHFIGGHACTSFADELNPLY
jgi:hypothetical protein